MSLQSILDVLSSEPVAVVAVLDAAFALAVSFGLNMDPKTAGALDALVIAALAVYARSKVTPVANLAIANLAPASPAPAK